MHLSGFISAKQKCAHNRNLTEWRVNKNGTVEISWSRCNVYGFHLFEASQRMTFWNQLRYCPLMKSSSDEKDYIVYHVAVPIQHNILNIFQHLWVIAMTTRGLCIVVITSDELWRR